MNDCNIILDKSKMLACFDKKINKHIFFSRCKEDTKQDISLKMLEKFDDIYSNHYIDFNKWLCDMEGICNERKREFTIHSLLTEIKKMEK